PFRQTERPKFTVWGPGGKGAADARSHQQSTRVAAARTAGTREGTAWLLRHRPSADAVRPDPGKIRAGQHRQAGGIAEPQPDADRRVDCSGAKWGIEEERQAVFDGHARRPRRLRAGA